MSQATGRILQHAPTCSTTPSCGPFICPPTDPDDPDTTDVDLGRQEIRVVGKGRRPRPIYVDGEASAG